MHMYLTNVCDPQLLSLGEVAQLYARRWDIEMAFRLLKDYLGMSHWWSSKQELILVQIWVVLYLSHIVYALRERIAMAANCEPCEVSVPLLVEVLPKLCSNSDLQLERLVQEGRQLGLLRASPRLALIIPQVELSCYQSAPPELPRQRPGRPPAAPRGRAPKPTSRKIGLSCAATEASSVQRDQGDQAAQAKASKAAQPPTGVT